MKCNPTIINHIPVWNGSPLDRNINNVCAGNVWKYSSSFITVPSVNIIVTFSLLIYKTIKFINEKRQYLLIL